MPIYFHYDAKNNILFETGLGSLTITDFFEYRAKVKKLPLQNNLKIISNYLDATLKLRGHEMKAYAELSTYLPQKYGPIQLAICAKDNINYGMARMFSLFSEVEGLEIEVFKDLKTAHNWLNINDAEDPAQPA